ncbi:PI-PLC domain-containing protein [Conexibacter woesei]|uniref:Uncharacterized protein n=1 Tax=Conexibacter woesei (strain DSM 14684 / CCUG 47730 / CIP 108061 / JCM 11494 / NBRC 100937 / ID131577) TaxID=469383 RepID=D3F1Q4_CONWI|nr:PI-PLC domain-containing protein [Conexibacter woesei]ADB54085.1 hypothetical protein Cwoe_5681 [Conexibacter woesei DSM 14684]
MRRIAVPALVCLAGLLVFVALPAIYVRTQLLDRNQLSERVGTAVTSEAVRTVAAQRIVDAAVDAGAEELLVTRPIAIAGIEALLGTPVVRQLARGAASDAHSLLTGQEGTFVLDLGRGTSLVLEGLRSVSPRVARAVPEGFDPEVLRIPADDPALASVRRFADLGGALAWIAPLLALACAAGALVLGAADRRRVLVGLGAAAAVASALLMVALAIGRGAAVPGAEADPDVAAAAGALWDALFGDLGVWAQTLLLAGAVLAVVAAARREEGGAVSRLLGTVSRVRTAGTPRWRAARAGALLAAAALIAWEPALALRLTAIGLAVYAISELAAVLDATSRRRQARRAKTAKAAGAAPARARRGAAAFAPRIAIPLAAVVAAIAIAALLTHDAPQPPTVAAAPATGCNGPRAYCDLRLDEYTFPGTHNSFSAAHEPGWLIPNQRFGIARQLDAGIRAFLLDVHVGVKTDQLVRTDLQAEGSDRNKVGKVIGPANLATAERLAGRVGAGDLRGRREPFLCHTLCELGAVPAKEQLRAFGRFLDRNRGEVLLFMMEPYLPPAQMARLFREAGLGDDVVTLDRAAPLPTLGDLVRADRRLLVFTEGEGGVPPWYMPAWSFFQDTPLGATKPSEFSCRRTRGDADSPLLLINHWIDAFPPNPRRNREIGDGFLTRRIARCERERGMRANVVAVDFYDRSDVVEASRGLNDRAAQQAQREAAVE